MQAVFSTIKYTLLSSFDAAVFIAIRFTPFNSFPIRFFEGGFLFEAVWFIINVFWKQKRCLIFYQLKTFLLVKVFIRVVGEAFRSFVFALSFHASFNKYCIRVQSQR